MSQYKTIIKCIMLSVNLNLAIFLHKCNISKYFSFGMLASLLINKDDYEITYHIEIFLYAFKTKIHLIC